MAQSNNSNNNGGRRPVSGPGPGDPLLAKQKHHHRRAFEYISKALKIDEENEGIEKFYCPLFYMLMGLVALRVLVLRRSS